MITEKSCLWCNMPFIIEHGNDGYCCGECADSAKRDRQKRKRDAVKKFFPIMFRNNEALEQLYIEAIMEPTAEQLEQRQVDISMCRWCRNPDCTNSILLDAGDYYLITDLQFKNFKLHKHVNDDSAA